MNPCQKPQTSSQLGTVRSVPFAEWSEADRFAAIAARRPAERLKRGGAASHMRDITFRDLARGMDIFSTTSSARKASTMPQARPPMSHPIESKPLLKSCRRAWVQ
jgi:hypothetical protein